MCLQNRVTPFGEVVAIPQRGLFTGNRGIIHDPATKTLLTRRWATKAWLICSCEYKGRRREVMAHSSWTELFFLDEAIALAAGHRPCFYCRREAAKRFRASWASEGGGTVPSAAEMDSILHSERIRDGRKRLHRLPDSLNDFPDGTVVAVGGDAFTLRAGLAHRWRAEGYAPPQVLKSADWLLTPPFSVMALTGGYRPMFHSSINTIIDRPHDARSL